MKKSFFLFLLILLPLPVLADTQETQNLEELQNTEEFQMPTDPVEGQDVYHNEYYKGKVVEIIEEGIHEIGTFRQPFQKVKVRILEGPDALESFEHEFQITETNFDKQKLQIDDKVVVVKTISPTSEQFYIAEPYRLPAIMWFFIIFFLVAVYFARFKGLSSIVGLCFSLLVIAKFVIPQIVAGKDPLLISIMGSLVILIFSLYLAHGFNKRTTVALAGTAISLGVAAGLAVIAANFGNMFGLGSEESISLLQGQLKNINLQGLFLGGVIIGALGVLDDITTAQSAVVDELHQANHKLPVSELYKRGLSVGREHIASLINTLALAYVGAALPLVLIFTQTDFPLWVIFNSELIAEEIIRTLVGSTALILAVPITTYLAAHLFVKDKQREADEIPTYHIH